MSQTPQSAGIAEPALAGIERLLTGDPRRAAQEAADFLARAPGHPLASLLLGIARRFSGDAVGAIAILEPLSRASPSWPAAQYELGRAHGAAGNLEPAISALRRAVNLQPALPGAWNSLAALLRQSGDEAGANAAALERIQLATADPLLREAESAIGRRQFAVADSLLRRQLEADPTDPVAMRMLAVVALESGHPDDAGTLLERCLELAPGYVLARYQYAIAMYRQQRYTDGLREIGRALAAEPQNPAFCNAKAVLLERLGEFEHANEVYADLVAKHPRQPGTWVNFGHSLTAAGRQSDAIAAYRKCIELRPDLGEAWWSLANLKTCHFTASDVDAMRRTLGRSDLAQEDRLHFEFALGKALEDAGDAAGSFAHYEAGNRLHRASARYDASEVTAHVRRSKALLTSRFFAERAGQGHPAPDPIFIVGLPRAGSTLLEQILASHSAVEATAELPDLIALVRELAARSAGYPDVLAELRPEELRSLGERYLESTRARRRSGAPMFVDKMPNNFAHVGLIHLILPKARIVDMRRHPLACCFSNFKQHFARGQHFTYGLEDLGRYYRDYVELMAHFDAVLPGRVHRVYYERLVEDTEAEVSRLLEYCSLPFETACLEPHAGDRAIVTPSSEQVRQPIYRDGNRHWRPFEGWLGPLKQSLGPVLDAYPGVPPFDPPAGASPI